MRCPSAITVSFVITLTVCSGFSQTNEPSEDQRAAPSSSSLYSASTKDSNVEATGQQSDFNVDFQSDGFYPAFSPFHNPPLGHSRPFYQPEAAYSHRPAAYQQNVGFDTSSAARFSGFKADDSSAGGERAPEAAASLLGSGNFGVLRGGTFYSDSDDQYDRNQFGNYYQNGHGRPSSSASSFYGGGNPKPRKYQQFENFRDFADINVATNPAYSQYVVVYANKNGAADGTEPKSGPKNINEHLALLDQQQSEENSDGNSEENSEVNYSEQSLLEEEKYKSKSKRKLAKVVLKKKPWGKKSKKETTETTESPDLDPLLALS